MCDEGAIDEGNLGKCRLCKEERTDVHEEELCGRPSLVTDELKEKVNVKNHGEMTIHIFSIRVTKRQKTLSGTGGKAWRRPPPSRAYKSWSHDGTSVLNFWRWN